MKRKFPDGNTGLFKLQQNFDLGNFLKPLLFKYRAYGYFCEGKHEVINSKQSYQNLYY